MTKIKIYLIGGAALFLMATAVTVNIQRKVIKKRNAEIARIAANNSQLMQDNAQTTTLYLVEKEVTGRLKMERDSLAKSLNIKPKQIEKIVYVVNSTHDTVIVEVPVIYQEANRWQISDTGKCYIWQGVAFLRDDSLKIQRTLFEYNNHTIETFYRKRPYKFLFIRFGKWRYHQKIDAECGSVQVKSINFSK